MGNCSGSPAGKKSAPVPKLSARKMGLDCRKCRNADLFKDIQNKYLTLKAKKESDGTNRTADGLHEEVMKDEYLVDMIERFGRDMDYDFDITRDAKREQREMLYEMGDDNPENTVDDIPGGRSAWESAKNEAVKQAVTNVTLEAVSEQLKTSAESTAEQANKVDIY